MVIGSEVFSEVFPSAGLMTIVLVASMLAGPYVGLLAVIAGLVMVNLTVSAWHASALKSPAQCWRSCRSV
jgi:hypothetical protein